MLSTAPRPWTCHHHSDARRNHPAPPQKAAEPFPIQELRNLSAPQEGKAGGLVWSGSVPQGTLLQALGAAHTDSSSRSHPDPGANSFLNLFTSPANSQGACKGFHGQPTPATMLPQTQTVPWVPPSSPLPANPFIPQSQTKGRPCIPRYRGRRRERTPKGSVKGLLAT